MTLPSSAGGAIFDHYKNFPSKKISNSFEYCLWRACRKVFSVISCISKSVQWRTSTGASDYIEFVIYIVCKWFILNFFSSRAVQLYRRTLLTSSYRKLITGNPWVTFPSGHLRPLQGLFFEFYFDNFEYCLRRDCRKVCSVTSSFSKSVQWRSSKRASD